MRRWLLVIILVGLAAAIGAWFLLANRQPLSPRFSENKSATHEPTNPTPLPKEAPTQESVNDSASTPNSETLTTTVTGRVLIGETHQPMGGILVQLDRLGEAKASPPRSQQSADDGTFVFSNLSAGRYSITSAGGAESSSHIRDYTFSEEPLEFDLEEGDSRDVGVLLLVTGGRISGQIFDKNTMRPVKGARVHTSPVGGGVITSSQPTNESGEYNLRGLANGKYEVSVQSPEGFAPTKWSDSRVVTIESDQHATGIDFALSRGRSISGTVVDENDHPVADAEIWSNYFSDSSFDRVVTSDSDGNFTFENAPEERTLLIAHKDELVSAPELVREELIGTNNNVLLRVYKGVSVSGTITDFNGKRAIEGIVIAQPVRTTFEPPCTFGASSDEHGVFLINGLFPGDYKLTAFKPSEDHYLPHEAKSSVIIEAPEEILKNIRAQIEKETGRALSDEEFKSLEDAIRNVPTPEGSIDLFQMPEPNPYRIFPDPEAEHSPELDVTVFNGQDLDGVVLRIGEVKATEPLGDLAVSGFVNDVSGKPIVGCRITLNGLPDPNSSDTILPERGEASTGSDGSFTITGLADGEYFLIAHCEGFDDFSLDFELPNENEIAIVLRQLSSIRGRVIDAKTRQPITVFEVGEKSGQQGTEAPFSTTYHMPYTETDGTESEMTHVDNSLPQDMQTVSNERGEFSIADLTPGVHTVFVRADGYQIGAQETGLLPDAERSEVMIALDAAPRLRGIVFDPAAKPLSHAIVQFNTPGLELRYPTDEQGKFDIPIAFEGNIELYVSHPDYVGEVVVLQRNQTDVRVQMTFGGYVSGVVTRDGEPMPHVSVQAEEAQQSERGTIIGDIAETDASGRFRLGPIAATKYRLVALLFDSASEEGYAVDRECTVRDRQTTQINLVLERKSQNEIDKMLGVTYDRTDITGIE